MCKGFMFSGLDIKHLVYMPIGHVVLKTNVPCKNFHVPGQYLYKPCKAYVYCWENKYKPWQKNHLPSRAHNHRFLCAVGQDLHAPGMWARLNVEPWFCNISHWLSCLRLFCYSLYGEVLSVLTHLPLDKMVAISQTTLSNAFSWMK